MPTILGARSAAFELAFELALGPRSSNRVLIRMGARLLRPLLNPITTLNATNRACSLRAVAGSVLSRHNLQVYKPTLPK